MQSSCLSYTVSPSPSTASVSPSLLLIRLTLGWVFTAAHTHTQHTGPFPVWAGQVRKHWGKNQAETCECDGE